MAEAVREPAVRKTIKVDAPIERAFSVFAEKMGTWWPASHHIAKQPFQAVIVEPRTGGRWYERSADGAECDWGRVTAWEPPKRVTLSWNLGVDFQYDPDMAKASEVEIRFYSEGPKKSRVELEHRHLERHGENYGQLQASVDSPDGWSMILAAYAEGAKQ